MGDEFDEEEDLPVVVKSEKHQHQTSINVIFQNPQNDSLANHRPSNSSLDIQEWGMQRSRSREPILEKRIPKRRTRSAPSPKYKLVKGEDGKLHVELDFNIVIVGEIGDGKSSLVQALCVDSERERCQVKRAYRGVTKDIRKYRVKPELLTNAYVLDSPGTGDADVSIRDLIYNMELFCQSTDISCIILTCDASKGRCTLGARLANSLVEKGFVNSYDHVVICGTKGDRLEDEEDRSEWVTTIADGINAENFDQKIQHVCISSLKMRRDKVDKQRFFVDLSHEDSNIEALLGCLKKVQALGKYAEYSMPDISELVSNLAVIIGDELTSKQKSEVKILLEDQKKDFENLMKQHLMEQQVAFTSGNIGNLLYAASKGDVEYVDRCMKNGLDIHVGDYDDRTALHLAVCEGQDEMVRFLVQNASLEHINACDRWGRTPLDDALTAKRESIIIMLKQAGAEQGETTFNIRKNSLRQTTNKAREIGDLLDAAARGDLAFVQECVSKGMDVYEGDYDKRTALHLAVCEKQVDVVRYLVRNSSSTESLNVRDRWGRTPIDDALSEGNQRIISILQLAGAEFGDTMGALSPSLSVDSSFSYSFPSLWSSRKPKVDALPRLQHAAAKDVKALLSEHFCHEDIVWAILCFCGTKEEFKGSGVQKESKCVIS